MNRAEPLHSLHAVVTGGGTGLGLAMARSFCSAGARVTIVGRREDRLHQAVAELDGNAGYVAADISDTAASAGIAARLEAVAPVDILVNNAGAHLKLPTLDTSDADFLRVLTTNLLGSFALTREVAKPMCERQSGSIIMITSMASLFGIPQVAAYTSSKAALAGLTRQLAVEFGAAGVRVNAIAPGFIETDMNRDIFRKDPQRLEKILSRTPAGRLGAVEDIAEAAVYLASPAARFVTGVSLPVDGGISIGF
ncbi:gluconate 5-dehydrogenase [Nitratireductor aquibiodomus]|uniref:Gluconate 5-dehydrogenase n=1 Tax=Nitratireductor aquibiodomus TaxID=204799 RepID=A0A1H4LRV7_9HYPH|nr:SDR family oxidoreductase [Nitratireductor aquibiodomus]SEB73376.1 gluconate 5-dehydrogenase [Nitratireductor aquibiodomus]